jgi:hypothetical protein
MKEFLNYLEHFKIKKFINKYKLYKNTPNLYQIKIKIIKMF